MRAEDCGDRGAAGAARGEHLGQARGHVPGQGPKAGARDWPARTPILGGRSRAPGVAVLIPVGHPVPNPRMRPSSSYGQPGSALLRGLGVSALPPSSPPWGERLGEKGGVSVSARRAVLLPLSAPDSSLQHPRFPAPPAPRIHRTSETPRGAGGSPASLQRVPASQSSPAVSWLPGFHRRGRGASSAEPTLVTLIRREGRSLPCLLLPLRRPPLTLLGRRISAPTRNGLTPEVWAPASSEDLSGLFSALLCWG